jgi:serine protease
MRVCLLVFSIIAACCPLACGQPICPVTRSEAGNKFAINVRLYEGYTLSDLDAIVSSESVAESYKSISLPEEVLDLMAENGMARSGEPLPNMNLWQTLQLTANADPDAILAELQSNIAVDIAEKVYVYNQPPRSSIVRGYPVSLPHRNLQTATPDFEPNQLYLNPAPQGIDAEFAWTQPGGTGAGIKLYDIEYSWNQNHEDLLLDVELLTTGTPCDPFTDDPNPTAHGTAVLGEVVGKVNGNGVSGICFDAEIGLAPEYTIEGFSVRATAIMLAVDDGTAGDVLLYEMQTFACANGDYGPAEWDTMVYDATLTATANGFVVVAAAGNGNVDLDDAGCEGRFNLNVRDSGAIIVGAGSAGTREKMYFSSYGSRVDVHGYGEQVFTTDYGDVFKDPSDPDDINRWYTAEFSGTSSASPIVAGAAVILQSYASENHGRRE